MLSTNPAVLRLAAYRLEHQLTFTVLADQMAAAGYPVKARALHLALTHRLVGSPRATTLYNMTRFVATVVARPAPKKRRRAA